MSEQSKAPKQLRSKKTVSYILEAMSLLLNHDPISKISTNKVADKAGVSIGSLYQFFPNKDELLRKVMKKEFNKKVNHFVDFIESYSITEGNLEQFCRDFVDFYLDLFRIDEKMHRHILISKINFNDLEFVFHNDEILINSIYKKLFSINETLDEKKLKKKLFFLIYAFKGTLIGSLVSPKEYRLRSFSEEFNLLLSSQVKTAVDSSNN